MTEQEKREKVIAGLECHKRAMYGIIDEHGHACNLCPYRDMVNSCSQRTEGTLIADALALLKAQEPRVMTLEEVKMLDSDYYYLESMRSPGKELREIVGAYGLTCVTWPSITWARQTMGDSGYGKTWRCWTSRPDEKRRAETPWRS